VVEYPLAGLAGQPFAKPEPSKGSSFSQGEKAGMRGRSDDFTVSYWEMEAVYLLTTEDEEGFANGSSNRWSIF
jgi:hypothetical protein